MVDMGVGEDEVVDFGRVEAEVAVHGVSLETLALVHATVEEDIESPLSGDEVLAARHLACGSQELQFHELVIRNEELEKRN